MKAEAEVARLCAALQQPSDELVTLAAKTLCDQHVGAINSVWDSPLTDKKSRCDDMRAVLIAVGHKLADLAPSRPPTLAERICAPLAMAAGALAALLAGVVL